MIRNALILIPFNAKIADGCDYAIQTLNILGKTNTVIGVALGDPISLWKSFPDVIRKRNLLITHIWNSRIVRPVFIFPGQRFSFIQSLNYIFFAICLKLYISYTQTGKRKILWFFEPTHLADYIKIFNSYTSVYDCVDYFGASYKSVISEEKYILSHASVVVTNSATLGNKLRQVRQDTEQVQLGFAEDVFKKVPKIRSPHVFTVGYVGGINYRINYSLLISIISELKDVHFHFVGPIQQQLIPNEPNFMPLFNKLRAFPNVSWVPGQHKHEMPAIISGFDIGLIPYDSKFPFNRYCFPMKTMEYFFLGKPVIATGVQEVVKYKPYVFIPGNKKSFVTFIKTVQKNGWQYSGDQKRVALSHSWRIKLDSISSIIMTKYPAFYDGN